MNLEELTVDQLEAENLRLGAEIDALRERRKAVTAVIDSKVRTERALAKLSPDERDAIIALNAPIRVSATANDPS